MDSDGVIICNKLKSFGDNNVSMSYGSINQNTRSYFLFFVISSYRLLAFLYFFKAKNCSIDE